MDLPAFRDAKKAETQPPAQIAEAGITFAASRARRKPGREPDLVAGGRPVDALQDKFQIEGELQLADDDEREIIPSQPDEIATADLALDRVSQALEKVFDGQVKSGFQNALSLPRGGGSGSASDRPRGRYSLASQPNQ